MVQVCALERQLGDDPGRARSHATDHHVVNDRTRKVQSDDLRDVPTHPDLGCPRVDQACLGSHLEPLDNDVEDRVSPPDLARQLLKAVFTLG